MYAVATRVSRRAVADCVHPTVEAGAVRFAAEEVQILLADKELGRIERIYPATRGRRGKRSFRVDAQQAETAIRRAEGVIHPRRRHGVETVGPDVIEAVVA